MRFMIVTAAITMLYLTPAMASSGTGIGKGSPPTPGTQTQTQPPANPCAEGETYDAEKNLCTRANGETYTPVPR